MVLSSLILRHVDEIDVGIHDPIVLEAAKLLEHACTGLVARVMATSRHSSLCLGQLAEVDLEVASIVISLLLIFLSVRYTDAEAAKNKRGLTYLLLVLEEEISAMLNSVLLDH